MVNSPFNLNIIELAQRLADLLPTWQAEIWAYERNARRTGLWPWRPDRIIFLEKLIVSADLIQDLAAQQERPIRKPLPHYPLFCEKWHRAQAVLEDIPELQGMVDSFCDRRIEFRRLGATSRKEVA